MTENSHSYIYVLTPFIGWIVAQGIKFAHSLKSDGFQWSDTLQSGGMPSSHLAFMASITTVVGVGMGFDSAVFALALAVTLIIAYDAMGVRRTTGEQTDALKQIAKKSGTKLKFTHDARGHTPMEVFAGAAVGVLVGIVTSYML